jgi:hypothetical protein
MEGDARDRYRRREAQRGGSGERFVGVRCPLNRAYPTSDEIWVAPPPQGKPESPHPLSVAKADELSVGSEMFASRVLKRDTCAATAPPTGMIVVFSSTSICSPEATEELKIEGCCWRTPVEWPAVADSESLAVATPSAPTTSTTTKMAVMKIAEVFAAMGSKPLSTPCPPPSAVWLVPESGHH